MLDCFWEVGFYHLNDHNEVGLPVGYVTAVVTNSLFSLEGEKDLSSLSV